MADNDANIVIFSCCVHQFYAFPALWPASQSESQQLKWQWHSACDKQFLQVFAIPFLLQLHFRSQS